jgi:hypothetical protein
MHPLSKIGFFAMKTRWLASMIVVLCLTTWSAAHAIAASADDILGLRCVTSAPIPAPPGTTAIPLPGGDFEGGAKLPSGWSIGSGKIVLADDAPQGKAYCRIDAGKREFFQTPAGIQGQPGRPHFLSFWLKSPAEFWAAINFTSEDRLPSFGNHYPGIPTTGKQWKRVGYYFWLPAQCRTIQFQIHPQDDTFAGQFIGIDDVQLRTATEAEMSAAYEAERGHLPAYDVTPRPGDGKNLALSVAKWEGRAGVPGRPFVIWALGSSWTAFQGDGYPLTRAIRERFPKAPPLIYKKHVGSGTPWDYARGWVTQFVAAEEPDLIFTYTNGTPEGLDAMLTEIRRHTTADVIVPSLHFFQKTKVTPEEVENGVEPWEKIREICLKHQAEFVENRRELAEYLKRFGLEPPALVGDAVHQNQHGRIRVWDNICRHIARPAEFTYAPESRERRIAVAPPAATATEHVELQGGWSTTDGLLRANGSDARLKVRFTGNRIDVLGRKLPGGGTVKVLVDGKPGEQLPVFFSTFIQPKAKQSSRTLKGPGPGDVAPHAVDLLANLVPQSWSITVTSDTGDYRLEGSVTGADGEGNLTRPFTSKSGQIGIDPKLWRHGRDPSKTGGVIYGNSTGDSFSFDVYRCALGQLNFRADQPAPLAEPVVQNLANREHTLELVTAGDGEVIIEGLYVYQPPETGN